MFTAKFDRMRRFLFELRGLITCFVRERQQRLRPGVCTMPGFGS
jgi:hypothetical protein